jgi:hypothetical protein
MLSLQNGIVALMKIPKSKGLWMLVNTTMKAESNQFFSEDNSPFNVLQRNQSIPNKLTFFSGIFQKIKLLQKISHVTNLAR